MDPLSAIATALIAGATAAASGVASKAVNDAYDGLKKLLADAYKFVSAALLHSDPEDPTYQNAVRAELKKKPAVADDKAVLQLTQLLQDALAKEPEENLKKYAIDIKTLESGKNIIAKCVTGGIRGEHWKADGSVDLSGASLGKP